MANNYRRGETYEEFILRQKAEASGKSVPKPVLPALTGDPVNHMSLSDAVAKILGRK
jgi:hypothetical protein